jgi:outer membrane receptor protein involved in Fe transport
MTAMSTVGRLGVSYIAARRALLLATSAFAGFIACPATAQTTQAPAEASAAAPAEGDIVVTAQKREERVQRVPINVSVLDGKVLDKQATGGILEALLVTPSVSGNTSDLGGVTQITIRGVAPSVPFGDGSGTVGYYVDGVPFGLGRSAGVPNTSDYDMARIEVLRGPQGTLYGASALNGVIHILTNDADPRQFEAKGRVGTATTEGGGISYQADGAINVPLIKDKLAIRVVGGFNHGAGWIDQPLLGKRNANWTDNGYVRVKLDYRPTDQLKIDLSAWLSSLKEGAPSWGVGGVQPHTPLPIPSKTRFGAYNGKIAYDLPFASISSSTSYFRLLQNVFTHTNNALTFLVPNLEDGHLYSRLPARVFAEEFLVNSVNAADWRWQVGAYYRDAQNDTYQTLPLAFGAGNNTSFRDASRSYAAFGQVTRTFFDDRVEVTGGLRYFHDRYETKTLVNPKNTLPTVDTVNIAKATTPRIVLAWLPDKNTNIYATYSVGFRSGLNQQPLAISINPTLRPAAPDKLYNYEVGAKGNLGGGVITYDMSVFYNKWKGVQQSGTIQLCNAANVCVPVGAELNGTSASGAGFDLTLGLHPTRGLNFGASLSDNDLKQDANIYPGGVGTAPSYLKGDRLPFSPRYTASAFANYSWSLSDNLRARYEISASYRSAVMQIFTPGQYGGLNGTDFTVCNGTNHCYSSGKPFSLDTRIEISNNHNQSIALYAANLTNWHGTTIPDFSESTMYRSRPRTFGIQLSSSF